jgi:hypothetical protein
MILGKHVLIFNFYKETAVFKISNTRNPKLIFILPSPIKAPCFHDKIFISLVLVPPKVVAIQILQTAVLSDIFIDIYSGWIF